MLIVLSPAKTLDFETPSTVKEYTQADLLDSSETLVDILITKSPHDLQKMMGISDKLAELNVSRFHNWSRPFSPENAKAALLAFKGDVYVGLQADTFNSDDLSYAQEHLRILSGLYGVLRPLDLIQPYRLEMGIKLENPNGTNLYQFWAERITDTLNTALADSDSPILLNLASNEYFKSVKKKQLKGEIVSPAFKDWKNGQYKVISFYAKKARGLMAAWVIKERINDMDALRSFNLEGYQYNPEMSDQFTPVFTRKLD